MYQILGKNVLINPNVLPTPKSYKMPEFSWLSDQGFIDHLLFVCDLFGGEYRVYETGTCMIMHPVSFEAMKDKLKELGVLKEINPSNQEKSKWLDTDLFGDVAGQHLKL